jgi:hypothetical protein
MNKRQAHLLGSLRSAKVFIDTNLDALAPSVKRGAKSKLDRTIASLTNHATNQAGDHLLSLGLTRAKASLREMLVEDHMTPIARIARAELPDAPEMAPLRMPSGELSVERLVAHAEGMANAAEPFAASFIEWGLSPTFIDELRQACADLRGSIDDRTMARGQRHGATVGIAEQLRVGRSAVGVLDAFVKSSFRHNPGLLQEWAHVSRVGSVPGRKARVTEAPHSPEATEPPQALTEPQRAPTPLAQSAAAITDPNRLLSSPTPTLDTQPGSNYRVE